MLHRLIQKSPRLATKLAEDSTIRELTSAEQELATGAKPKPKALTVFQRTGRWP